jgi:DegV family protein with EDD domain
MRIITNPGSNLPQELVRELDIVLAPQIISVGGVAHDMRDGMTIAEMEALIRTTSTHPFVLGSSASELAALFSTASKTDGDLVAIMSARRLVGSYDACLSAARVMKERAGHGRTNVHVIDTGFTDLGAGLPTVLAALAARAGLSAKEVVALVEAFCRGGAFAFVPADFDYLTRSGRATAIRAFFKGTSTQRPIVTFVDSDFAPGGAVGSHDVVRGLADHVTRRIAARRPVWVGISHAGRPGDAGQLDARLRQRFDVRYCLLREMSVSAYDGFGPGCLMLFVAPIDELPWIPT